MGTQGESLTDQRLCGLVTRVNQVLEAHVRRVADSLGITSSQAVALRELSEPMTLRALAASMGCESSNAGYVVDRMEEQGLVTRQPHPSDRRAKLVALTAAGKTCRRNVIAALEKDAPTASLDPDDSAALVALLSKVIP